MRRLAFAVFLLALSAVAATAQQDTIGPKKGTWGGEACIGCVSATMLKFRDPNSAWLWRVSANYQQVHSDETFPTGQQFTSDRNNVFVSVGFGARFYRMTESRVRPFMSLLGTVGYLGGAGRSGYLYGASAEMGSSYFFTDNLSAGLLGSLDLSASQTRSNQSGGTSTDRNFSASFNGVRLIAAVYF